MANDDEAWRKDEKERLRIAEEKGPVPYEDHLRLDRERFERRRAESREFCREQMEKEIEATIAPSDDPDMAEYIAEQRREIEARWAENLERQIARIDRDERERLERTRILYGRVD